MDCRLIAISTGAPACGKLLVERYEAGKHQRCTAGPPALQPQAMVRSSPRLMMDVNKDEKFPPKTMAAPQKQARLRTRSLARPPQPTLATLARARARNDAHRCTSPSMHACRTPSDTAH